MASIRKLKNGSFQVSAYLGKKRIRKCFRKKSEALKFKIHIENETLMKNNLGFIQPKIEIQKEIENFLAFRNDLRPNSIKKYTNFLRQFSIFCKKSNIIYVDDFSKEHARIFFNFLIQPRKDPKGSTERVLQAKPRTVNFYLTMAKRFFNEMKKKDLIKFNPFESIENIREEKKIPEYYSEDELKRFFNQPMKNSAKNAFVVLLNTGMRFGELANLQWADVDLENRLITIRHKENFSPKTINSNRVIPINDTLFDLLKKLYDESSKDIEDYVIKTEKGKKIRERNLYAYCNKIGKAAGISGSITLHKFRHTFASLLVKRGVRIEEIQKLLGHSSIKETLIYAHIEPQTLHSKVNLLNNLF